MIIKVCGLKDKENILAISNLNIDMVGYNFYPQSPRFVEQDLPSLPNHIKKAGVFVNADIETIAEKVKRYKLDFVQLHGNETLEFTKMVHTITPVIKVFGIGDSFDFKLIDEYQFCEYLLFDTASKNYGGSGKKFNWEIIDKLNIKTPFLLSGGIGPDDIAIIKNVSHPYFVGIDINSKFELMPGIKSFDLLKTFIDNFDKK